MTAVSRAVVALALVAAPVAAQAPGLPVHGGGFRTGLELAATVGWAGSATPTGDATTFAGTLAYGWSRLGLAGTAGVIDGGASMFTVGLLASVRLLGNGVETPFEVSAFGGAGTFSGAACAAVVQADAGGPCDGSGHWRIPLGAAMVLAITTPIVSVRPWIAPRAEILEVADGVGGSTSTKFALSTGLDLRFPGGLGLRALWEKVDDQDQTLGVGLSFRF